MRNWINLVSTQTLLENEDWDDEETAMADYRSYDREAEPWAYHCTFERNLPSIIRDGALTANNEPNFDFSKANAIYATSEDGAQFYSLELEQAYQEKTVIIRFPMPENTIADEYGNLHDFHFSTPIPVSQIEIESESGGRFIPLTSYEAKD